MFNFYKTIEGFFVAGNTCKRRAFFQKMLQIMRKEYSEDNYNTGVSWLVEEILISDKKFKEVIKTPEDAQFLKNALSNSIDRAWKYNHGKDNTK